MYAWVAYAAARAAYDCPRFLMCYINKNNIANCKVDGKYISALEPDPEDFHFWLSQTK